MFVRLTAWTDGRLDGPRAMCVLILAMDNCIFEIFLVVNQALHG